jgi:vacuolar-type H+-ATPase subunit I/STV1
MPKTHKVPQLTEAERKVVHGPEPATMGEALQNAKDLIDERTGDNLIPKIRSFDGDVKSFQSRIKTLNEQVQEEIENTNEYTKVAELTTDLAVARAALKRRLESNSSYVDLMSDLADEKLSLKDAQENMSDFLLAYFKQSGERQIELGPQNAREVVLKGKLGKAKEFQTNLFTPPPISSQERKEREE